MKQDEIEMLQGNETEVTAMHAKQQSKQVKLQLFVSLAIIYACDASVRFTNILCQIVLRKENAWCT